ncbi:riboflavin biosynthesis protein RibD [Amycolatopsis mediterranei S699]|uniref:Riboflavin biosynthesis protein RibD n=2 Tax=Amycolatopsis mediterranei TaxID=33910 RepID=A0A0H3CVB0_AMYMU|nr:dihydrofolate reductase family protein [Amycolatopsis mediterranei]ADJ42233.1 riboflavin biosynthesis protein RibD [Amycolatopsis mediterranei U32]AEK38914.1 riboflavin biosynthesis protein RibD [Amycolatopsis mediterranei S699]AFO73947.1 riboflavin biosynthesis protein RibD [Amycolatopsis mediterranei S699]AGT81076.1 riboflavin biosynthesis protein RibD [Amycolatopsis mediterranei RB]KDO06136.1 riboflavin biosynthesis protein RibD [Amycolatopsis mediterranei]
MATVHAGMSMSLDGFVADRHGGTARLSDPAASSGSEWMTDLIRETGAVVLGRRSFAMAEDPDWYAGNYEFQVPIFVVTHTPPAVLPAQNENLTFTFVTDGIASAVKQARAAAGDRAVKVIGASVVRQAVRARVADELHVLLAPVLLGAGLPLFGDPDLDGVALRRLGVREVGPITELRFTLLNPL